MVFVPVFPLVRIFTEEKMSKGVLIKDRDIQSCNFDVIPLLSLAEYYGELRRIPGIWGVLLTDLLKLPGYSTARIAHVTELGARSISRLIPRQEPKSWFCPGIYHYVAAYAGF